MDSLINSAYGSYNSVFALVIYVFQFFLIWIIDETKLFLILRLKKKKKGFIYNIQRILDWNYNLIFWLSVLVKS